MTKTTLNLIATVFLANMVCGQTPKVVTVLNGFDPIELVDNREVKGSETISVTRSKYRYLFARAENKRKFERSPAEFQIQLGGGCGRMGSLSGEGNPDRYHVFNRRIYIFASEQCRNSFKAAPENHLESPDPAPTGSAAEKLRAGELLDLAVTAIGGSAKVNAIKTYQAKINLAYKQGDKTTEYKQTETIAFPNRYHNEIDWGSATEVSVLTPGAAVTSYKNESWVREEPVRAALEREFHHHPLAILKSRSNPGFIAFSTGKVRIGDNEIELVKVGINGSTTTLGIDAKTGRILQISYRGRKSAFGEIIKSFSDFREVDELILPFKVEESFNGKPIASPVVTYDSVTINNKLDESLFRKQK